MPRKPKHPCAYPGCPGLIEAGQRYTDQWYVITGTLMVKETGDPLVENGKEITVTSEPFKPWRSNGKQKINTKGLEGKELVAFETAYRLDGFKKDDDVKKAKRTKVAEHKDINDR